MAYHVELKGSALSSKQSDTAAYVLQGSVSIETAIAERPQPRSLCASLLASRSRLKTSTKSPSTIRRCPTAPGPSATPRWSPTGGWTKRRSRLAVDSTGSTPLTYGGGTDLQYRAFRQETSAVPYGGAPEWEHTSGAGLSGTLPAAVGAEFTIAGFVRRKAGAPGLCNVWRAGGNNSRSLRLAADGTVRLAWGGQTLTTAVGVAQEGVWHHVAATNDATNGLRLWVDGAVVASAAATTATLDGLAWQMARALGGAAVDLALDEWGIWSEALDVAALYCPTDASPGLRRLRLRRGGRDRPRACGPACARRSRSLATG